jgi:protein adenylyltransferase
VLARLGLRPIGPDDDEALVAAVIGFLDESRMGFDRFFFDWYGGAASDVRAQASPAASHFAGPHFALLRRRLERYTPRHPSASPCPTGSARRRARC